VAMPAVKGHTHGESAASRSSASLLIDTIARQCGKNVVFFQGSAADQRNGRLTSRTFYWSKDQHVSPTPYRPTKDDMVAMTDVDYYVDMIRFLSANFRPVLLYTFQPSNVCKDSGEYKYTFNENDEVLYTVSGGGSYQHKVWNYNGDSIVVKSSLFGCIPWTHSTFSIERRQIDADHQVVMLTPVVRYVGVAAWFAASQIQGVGLERLKVTTTNVTPCGKTIPFLRMTSNKTDGMYVHTGIANGYSSSTTRISVDDEIASQVRMNPKAVVVTTIKSKLKTSIEGCEILLEYHKTVSANTYGQTVSTVETHVRSYQFVKSIDEFEPEAKPAVVAFMKPLYDGAFAPSLTRGNEQRSIDKRVNAVKDKTQLSPFLYKVIREYVDKLVPIKHTLHPYGEEELQERQKTPAQRRILEVADFTDTPDRVAKAFGKRECYPNIADPRNITTINGVDKRAYAYFIYAFAATLKEFDWYAFGKTPIEVSQRVAEICSGAKFNGGNTDFSRMDGRVGEVLRELERQCMMAMFMARYHDELLDLLRSQQGLKGRTRLGVLYHTGLGRLSGSMETSPFNTNDNAFVAFLAFRKSIDPDTGTYYTPDAAWLKLGIYGGDDGITADVDPNIYMAAALSVGQKLTIEVRERGEVGIKFLARQYGPTVWQGDHRNVCDFARLMSKFHTTITMPNNISAASKLFDKAYAAWLSDKDSPVIGQYLSALCRLAPPGFKFKNLDNRWMPFGLEEDVQYESTNADWAKALFNAQMPDFDSGEFLKWVESIKTIEEAMIAPCFSKRVEPVTPPDSMAVVDDEIFISEPAAPPPKKEVLGKVDKFRRRKAKEDRVSRADNKARPTTSPTLKGPLAEKASKAQVVSKSRTRRPQSSKELETPKVPERLRKPHLAEKAPNGKKSN